MSHRYPTLTDEVSKVNTYAERLKKLIFLYEYVRDTPILMESVVGFREDVREKLNILEELLIEKSHRLNPFDPYHGTIEILILNAMSVIDDIRAKYY